MAETEPVMGYLITTKRRRADYANRVWLKSKISREMIRAGPANWSSAALPGSSIAVACTRLVGRTATFAMRYSSASPGSISGC